jgi:hypothetical protein
LARPPEERRFSTDDDIEKAWRIFVGRAVKSSPVSGQIFG